MKTEVTVFFIILLVGTSSYLGYSLYNTEMQLNSTITQLQSTISDLESARHDIAQKTSKISSLEGDVSSLTGEVTSYKYEVAEKQRKIIESQAEISKLSKIAEEQKKKIASLRDILRDLDKTGNLISENYYDTLILYDNSQLYELFKPLFAQVADDQEDYSQLGIPFIYFRDQSKKNEEGIILGQYSGLYDTIFIYNDASEVRTIYHEIAHIIYQRFFAENANNKQVWSDTYNYLKQNSLLSTSYGYESEIEGFAEEYSVYKTNANPSQPENVKSIFSQLDAALR